MGEGALKSITEFIPNIIIIATSGLRVDEGIFCHGSEESAVKKLLWTKHTDIRLIATDWTKIGKRDAHSFGPVEQLGYNATQAVVVTCEPPKRFYKEAPERVKEFESQIRKMESYHIIVEKVSVPESPAKNDQA